MTPSSDQSDVMWQPGARHSSMFMADTEFKMNLIIHLPSLFLTLNQYQLNHSFQNITGVIKKLFEILIEMKKKQHKATLVFSYALILLVV